MHNYTLGQLKLSFNTLLIQHHHLDTLCRTSAIKRHWIQFLNKKKPTLTKKLWTMYPSIYSTPFHLEINGYGYPFTPEGCLTSSLSWLLTLSETPEWMYSEGRGKKQNQKIPFYLKTDNFLMNLFSFCIIIPFQKYVNIKNFICSVQLSWLIKDQKGWYFLWVSFGLFFKFLKFCTEPF